MRRSTDPNRLLILTLPFLSSVSLSLDSALCFLPLFSFHMKNRGEGGGRGYNKTWPGKVLTDTCLLVSLTCARSNNSTDCSLSFFSFLSFLPSCKLGRRGRQSAQPNSDGVIFKLASYPGSVLCLLSYIS